MFRIRTLILITVIEIFVIFVMGLIHPIAVFLFEFFGVFFVTITALVLFVISIVKLIRDLFKPEKMILTNLCKIALCYILISIFGLSHYISFAGLSVHYWFVKDYSTIRTWANNVKIPDGGLLEIRATDIPAPVKPFNPETVHVEEEKGVRRLHLRWDSGLMQMGWELIVCPPDEIYQVKSGMLAKIHPGVYLYYESYPH